MPPRHLFRWQTTQLFTLNFSALVEQWLICDPSHVVRTSSYKWCMLILLPESFPSLSHWLVLLYQWHCKPATSSHFLVGLSWSWYGLLQQLCCFALPHSVVCHSFTVPCFVYGQQWRFWATCMLPSHTFPSIIVTEDLRCGRKVGKGPTLSGPTTSLSICIPHFLNASFCV